MTLIIQITLINFYHFINSISVKFLLLILLFSFLTCKEHLLLNVNFIYLYLPVVSFSQYSVGSLYFSKNIIRITNKKSQTEIVE